MEGGPLRIGFVSSFFVEHTVGRLMEGVITGLPGHGAEVIVYSAAATNDTRYSLLHKTIFPGTILLKKFRRQYETRDR